MSIIKFAMIESKLIKYHDEFVIVDSDVAELYGVETRDVNKAVKNNPDKFPDGYIIELTEEEKGELVENFDRFNKLKHSTVPPKAFTEKGLYMLATIIKSQTATQTMLQIIETFAKVKELSRNINAIMKTQDEAQQKELAGIYQDFFEKQNITFVKEPQDAESNYWLGAIVLDDLAQRDEFLEYTNANGVMTRPIWTLMNRLEMFKDAQCGDLSNAQYLEDRVVNIPSSVTMTKI